jgi:two-component system NtrC family response regulator
MGKASKTLLIIEDDPGLQSQMRWCFEDLDVHVAGDKSTALALMAKHQPRVITLDLGLPPDPGGTSEGFEVLDAIRHDYPNTKTIVITGREERESAVHAIAAGAHDFYQKPIDAQTLKFVVERAFKLIDLEDQNRKLCEQSKGNMPLPGLLATSPVMLNICKQVERIAPTEANVLITGETGTGKEIIAHSIHHLSPRAAGPLVTINCAAIPENLLESELFGHEKGSFTGAHTRTIGKVEAANGGTLFLDEIGDMPAPLQAKILRFLQERTFERIGATQSVSVDVRVVAATHRDLVSMIDTGEFREDLFFRLSEIVLDLPPLRRRGSDVLLIARHLLQKYKNGRALRFDDDALQAIEAWRWTGNVRELENRVRRATILADGNFISPIDLELTEMPTGEAKTLKDVRAEAETSAIKKSLLLANHNMSAAARLLGVSRPTLYSLIEKYGIATEVFEEE